jgi:putative phosphoesterase
MRQCIDSVKPNAVVHLGDCYDDGQAMAEEYPYLYFYRVPGNWDKYSNLIGVPAVLVSKVCGVRLFMTHGHLHGVRTGLDTLIRDASQRDVQAVLFGHTHSKFCKQTESGIWIMNPGSCCGHDKTAGLITVESGKISDCRFLRQSDLEALT